MQEAKRGHLGHARPWGLVLRQIMAPQLIRAVLSTEHAHHRGVSPPAGLNTGEAIVFRNNATEDNSSNVGFHLFHMVFFFLSVIL